MGLIAETCIVLQQIRSVRLAVCLDVTFPSTRVLLGFPKHFKKFPEKAKESYYKIKVYKC